MSTAKRVTLAAVAGGLLLIGAGVAVADEGSNTGFPSTQNPGQLGTSVTEIVGEFQFEGADALNGDNRPDGANGVENEFPPVHPRYIEGPVGGLLNGPQD
ncbi:hypothetical protein [Pseudonocardia sp.]|uniref:hypothetical protein n=1 Tax=Pseudonocardia sp. TaxID=60912 RepID=UPI00261A3424|nr:hypothetical protein [Pseudonocardia sp.]